MKDNQNLFTLKELCSRLSISPATGKNWIKLNKLTPTEIIKNKPYFSEQYIKNFEEYIKSEDNNLLKRRRNKKHISGNGAYKSYICTESSNNKSVQSVIDIINKTNTVLCDEYITAIVAECALRLLCQRLEIYYFPGISCLSQFLCKDLKVQPYNQLINDLIEDKTKIADFIALHPDLFSIDYSYEDSEDILGLLYISIKNTGERKATGAYYTPTNIVKQLVSYLSESTNKFKDMNVLDPCCGTGNFLLQLPENVQLENIFGNDIDPVSAKIARINLALRFQPDDIKILYTHVTELDYLKSDLKDTSNVKFNCILGNPPWGYHFSENDSRYMKKHYNCTSLKNIESYDVFIEKSLSQLEENGFLSFILPEAILNVRSHSEIRNEILKISSIKTLSYLGNAFDQAQCPCIILELCKTNKELSTEGMTVHLKNNSFVINTKRNVSDELFSFTTTDEEYELINKILYPDNKKTLKDNADFALGIVTGNNKEYITHEKTAENEVILKGSDIYKYSIADTNNYIVFAPDKYQQIAPVSLYRAPEKLLYRFISGQLVFAYDNKQTLSLNSCNIIIPNIPDMDIKYIMAVLNSRIAQFIFNKQFNSVKVLRSHIEQIPFPMADVSVQKRIIEQVDTLMTETDNDTLLSLYNYLDSDIAHLFNLSVHEYNIIMKSLEGQNLFLGK